MLPAPAKRWSAEDDKNRENIGGDMLSITTDVFCDICGNWTQGAVGRTIRVRQARENAASRGWRQIKRDGKLIDICPVCLGEKTLREYNIDNG